MIEWLNNNNGFIMALLTLIYVVATVLILLANNRTAKTAQKQLKEMQNQTFEMNRGMVIVNFYVMDMFVILTIKNIGKSTIEKGKISMSVSWLEFIKPELKDAILNLTQQTLYLAPNQTLNYIVEHIPIGGSKYEQLRDSVVGFRFEYSTLGKQIQDSTQINLNPYLSAFYGFDVEEKMTSKISGSIDNISENLKTQNDILMGQSKLLNATIQEIKEANIKKTSTTKKASPKAKPKMEKQE